MNVMHTIWLLPALALVVPFDVSLVSAQHDARAGHDGRGGSAVAKAVRQATERFRHVEAAISEGYVQFQGCVSGPAEGAMGVHYSKFALFDDEIDLKTPEVLVYEPKNGRLELVAAEYVAPAPLWDPTHDDFEKPQLMGHLFHFAPGPNRYGPTAIYELHVWAWKQNPRGLFADWNPNVSCADWWEEPADR